MTVPTRAVTFDIHESDGSAIEGAVIKAKMTAPDIYEGQILDRVEEQTTSAADGSATLNLFPNVLGERGTAYLVTIRHPTTGRVIMKAVVRVPDADSVFTDLIGNAAEGVSQAGSEAFIKDLIAPGIIAKIGVDAYALRTIEGTENQVIVTDGNGQNGNPVLSLPQDIHTGASPTFAALTVSAAIAAASIALSGGMSSASAAVSGGMTVGGTLGVTGAATFSSTIGAASITSSGQFLAADGSAAAPSYAFTTNADSGLFKAGANTVGVSLGATERFRFTGSAAVGFTIHQSHPLSWGSAGVATPDAFLWREAAETIAQRHGGNAQSFRIYNTYTDAANYERAALEFSSNTLILRSQAAGTGTVRDLRLSTTGVANVIFNANNVDEWTLVSGGNLRPPSARDNLNDFGSSSARVRTGFFTNLDSGAASALVLKTNNGATQFAVSHTAGSVNFLQVTGAAAGGSVGISAQGADTNVGINFAAKAAGGFRFMTNGFNDEQFRINANASAVNYLAVSGGIVSNWPSIVANGADTNIGILIRSKGASPIEFDTNGSTQQFRVGHTASAVNYVQVTGGATGVQANLGAGGSDTNVNLRLFTQGTGQFEIVTNGQSGSRQFAVFHTASAVNYVQATGAAAGNAVTHSCDGSDTNITVRYSTKGTGAHDFFTRSATTRQFMVSDTASAVNYAQATGSPTGSGVPFGAQGSDTDITMTLYSKGAGSVTFATGGNAVTQFRVTHTASAVNTFAATGSTTGNGVTLGVIGSDTNVSINYNTKGSGQHNLTTGGGNQFTVKHTASAVNNLSITGAAASGSPTLSAEGSDSTVNITLAPKGAAGKVLGGLDVLAVACSDETTALTTGTAKVTFRMPYAMTLYAVRGSLTTAQTSGSIFTVDINESGTTILSTKLTIDNTEKTSTTAATAPVLSDTALADDAEITVDIDQVGDGTAKGLKIYLIGKITG